MNDISKAITHSFFRGAKYLSLVFVLATSVCAQELYPVKLKPELWHDKPHDIRYQPEGGDFVMTNGTRRFTRALYGTNTAFRVEAGDLPEFAMYMPGMGGNLKFGLIGAGKSKWLITTQKITARYRPGSMLYDIEDPMLGKGKLHLIILPLGDAEGMIVKATFTGVTVPVELFWAYGGASGRKFSRDGDMGPDPESSFYLKPEYCTDNNYQLIGNTFTLKYGTGELIQSESARYENPTPGVTREAPKRGPEKTMLGFVPASSDIKVGDAKQQGEPLQLYASGKSANPLVMGRLAAKNNEDLYFGLHNPASATIAFDYSLAPKIFASAEAARMKIAGRIKLKTPDPYINTVGAALGIAADAIWESPSYLHGSIGWRIRLNGWRGPYTGDELGWHDRAREHFKSYAQSQLTGPDSGPNAPDTLLHLSRQVEKIGTAVFTNGYISRNPGGKNLTAHHYDMNMVYIDELLWHFNWTGDLVFAKEMWPVIKRHLAWERRNFDGDNDGLYDAYAAIWASDALQYSGGGVTHSSAYNYRANKKAAEIATFIGEDPTPYQKEAERILTALNAKLWMPSKGWYAEYKDLLGLKSLHPAAALWTVYHSLDSEVPDPFQAYQTLRYVDTEIPHIPLKSKGIPEGYYTLSTSKWMPYEWSLNNVALAESMHTALANWQGGRPDEAFKLWKSELLASMYLGGSPGNIVQISYYDAARGEAYRDFGDPVGMTSRALVEGLFGIVPDAMAQTLTIRPGLPSSWNYASLDMPDISYDFKRTGFSETYTLIPHFPKPMDLKFKARAPFVSVKSVTVNGKAVKWRSVEQAVGQPELEIDIPAAAKYAIQIIWQGAKPSRTSVNEIYARGKPATFTFSNATVVKVFDPQATLRNVRNDGHAVSATISGEAGNRTAFVQLKQGSFIWWYPLCFEVKGDISILARNNPDKDELQFSIQNNTQSALQGTVQVNSFTVPLTIGAASASSMITVPAGKLIPGNNRVQVKWGNSIADTSLVNWNVAPSADAHYETVDISKYFNDKVTSIFKNQYFSPRSPYPTLQLPSHGMGEWTHPLDSVKIDDSGLRKLAGSSGLIRLPQGIVFQTPGEVGKPNILFTSQWDVYPKETSVPVSGSASHAYFLMAGSTNPMQSRLENGVISIEYTDGTSDRLILKNPQNWWPIEQDYMDDNYAFTTDAVRPVRIHLKTGLIVIDDAQNTFNGKKIDGGAATVLDLPLNPSKTLKALNLKTLANDVVIGLMSLTLKR